jgi:hypothetical protein
VSSAVTGMPDTLPKAVARMEPGVMSITKDVSASAGKAAGITEDTCSNTGHMVSGLRNASECCLVATEYHMTAPCKCDKTMHASRHSSSAGLKIYSSC